jgi:hypothetical protein
VPVRGFTDQTLVVFTEHWRWPPPGRSGRLFRGGWIVTVGPSGKVRTVRVHGAIPPQLWM